MLRKTVFYSFILTILFFKPSYSGDTLSWLIGGGQSSLVVGIITSITENSTVIEPTKVISGTSPDGIVQITNISPDIISAFHPGDPVVVSLSKITDGYSIQWGMFKANSQDHAVLKIINSPMNPMETAVFERYIHSEGKDTDFYFNENKAFLKKNDGTEEQIYPTTTDTGMGQPAEQTVVVHHTTIHNKPSIKKNSVLKFALVIVVFVILIISILFVIYFSRYVKSK